MGPIHFQQRWFLNRNTLTISMQPASIKILLLTKSRTNTITITIIILQSWVVSTSYSILSNDNHAEISTVKNSHSAISHIKVRPYSTYPSGGDLDRAVIILLLSKYSSWSIWTLPSWSYCCLRDLQYAARWHAQTRKIETEERQEKGEMKKNKNEK